ncbi:hypothetical protein TSUD_352500 [Trifolium subterraneum]|nr:hypothetical protein TSUD_352500 [Trifolium subterraneum]
MAAALVAGAFLSATIQTIAEKLSSTEFRGFISNTKFNYSLLAELKTTLFSLQAVLVDAEQKQFNDLPVKQWLDDLKDAIFYSEDLLNLISYDALRCKVENTPTDQLQNLSSSMKINSKMEKMCKRLQTFVQQKDILGLQRTVSGRVRRTPSSSVVNESITVGRNDDKDRLIDVLVSDCGSCRNNNFGVVAILGMGGVGKTTLAQLVYNDENVEKHFDLKAWVYVSEDFDIVRATKSLLESVVRNTTSTSSKVWESDNLDILRVELMKQLIDRKFLFVLDDLWNDNYIDWNELVTPMFKGKTGSKVIITTREQKVAEIARTFPIHKLEPLSDEDCWSLLSMHAIGGEYLGRGKYPKLEAIGRKISRKCNGLPIAAKALSGLMRLKVDEKEWNAILNSDIWKLQNDKILPALHLSYQYLPSHLKVCFAYCSIFSKDYSLDRKKLVLLWMAEGFLDYSHSGKSIEEVVGKRQVGLSIKELRKLPHLQGTLTIKNLHNVIDATEAGDANLKSKEQIEKLELQWGEQTEDSRKEKDVPGMLQPSVNLKKLSIDMYGGTSFPSWLGDSSFSNMVFLGISNGEHCMTFPPLGQLPSLKDLLIYGMEILERIGPEFYCGQAGQNSDPSFKPFPSLECLMFRNMPNWKEWLPFVGNNFAFPRLKILILSNCPKLRGNFPNHLSSIEVIKIEGCPHLLETPSTFHWLSSIKKINIKGCDERTQWSLVGSDSSCRLQHVTIERCDNLLSLPKMVMRSTCIQHLTLNDIPSLTAFPTDFQPTSLQSLHISMCKNLTFLPPETWSSYTSLVSLELWSSCDALTSFSLDGFPALERLYIYSCKNLDSIFISESPSHHASSLQSLKIKSHYSIGSLKVKLRMDTLTALEELSLGCRELSFCEGVFLPSKLQSIDIQSRRITAQPVTEWGFQGLTALSSLSIGKDDEIVNALMKESLLPVSLVSLTISHLYKMKCFDGNGLRHLSSLENLDFLNCQQLESLPGNFLPSSLKSLEFCYCKRLESLPEDSLPSSLKLLVVWRCPILEERYKMQEHWSKIAHIPVIIMEDQVTI